MTTHQALTGGTDEEFVQRMVRSYPGRHGDAYWAMFDERVRPRLGDNPVIADLGCGPGGYVQDLSNRVPGAILHGYDVTPAMVDHAKTLAYGGDTPTLDVLDVQTSPIPAADGSFDLINITALLHLFDDPFPVLAEVKRALRPSGTLLVYDWVRTPIAGYVARDMNTPSPDAAARTRAMKLWAFHNRYTEDDWRWVLGEAGFEVLAEGTPGNRFHRLFVTAPR